MKRIDPDAPAFSRPASVDTSGGTMPDGDIVVGPQAGISVRGSFAALAPQGLCADDSWTGPNAEGVDQLPVLAVMLADRLIDALNAPKEPPK